MTKKYIMVSLEDDKAKDLANVISNKTSRKILDILSEENLSESDLAKRLGLPASTINYNIKHLLKNNLIKVKDFYWSQKGNKVNIYTISRKFIVIAPKGVKFKETLKKVIPVSLLALIGASLIQFFTKLSVTKDAGGEMFFRAPVEEAAMDVAQETFTNQIVQASINYGYWFFAGAVFVILIYLIFDYWRYKKNEKN